MVNSTSILISPKIQKALKTNLPIVALETTVITHGLPYPDNKQLAFDMQANINKTGAVPATIGVLDGKVRVGLSDQELEGFAQLTEPKKVSLRDIGAVIARGESGGTTVAATAFIASQVGIKVFATGGIGGVHRGTMFDISTDLQALARMPVIVVCSGAKAILDLPATLEYLETMGVPVLGYQTDEFPAFYTSQSGIRAPTRADTAEEVVQIAHAHWNAGLPSAILVTVPPPEDAAMEASEVEAAISSAVDEAERKGIRGQAVTPYLLERVKDITAGKSLEANLALLRNNASVAASIAGQLSYPSRQTHL